MPLKFTVLILQHYKFGLLLVPFLSKMRSEYTEEIDIIEPVTPDKISELSLNDIETKIVHWAHIYQDENIYQRYCKDKKKLTLIKFIDGLTDDFIRRELRPMFERRMQSIIEVVHEYQIPIFIKDRRQRYILQSNQLTIHPHLCKAQLNVCIENATLIYTSQIIDTVTQEIIPIYSQSYSQLIRFFYFSSIGTPAYIVVNSILYKVENIDASKLLPFHKKERQVVDGDVLIQQFLERFLRSTIQHFEVQAKGFDIIKEHYLPQPLLTFENDITGRLVLSLSFQYGDKIVRCNEETQNFIDLTIENDRYVYRKWQRDEKVESMYIDHLVNAKLEHNQGTSLFLLPYADDVQDPTNKLWFAVEWMSEFETSLKTVGITLPPLPESITQNHQYFIGTPSLKINLTENKDWFDIYVEVKFGEYTVPFSVVRKAIIKNQKTITLPDKKVAVIPAEWFAQYGELCSTLEGEHEKYTLKKVHYTKLTSLPLQDTNIHQFSSKFDVHNLPPAVVPDNLASTLRDYQKKGYYWLMQLQKHNFGGCLADDMGLGKTLQTITVLSATHNNQISSDSQEIPSLFDFRQFEGTTLVVAPTSLLFNWESELHRFAPHLSVINLSRIESEHRYAAFFRQANVLLCSYALTWRLYEVLSKVEFTYIVLDESQHIKNPESQTYKAILKLSSKWRITLTGTPIENRLEELWAQMNFLNPGLLGTLPQFQRQFVNPIKNNDNRKLLSLKKYIEPYLLRRTKHEVTKQLPPLTKQVIYCEMTKEQKSVYEREKSKIRNFILDQVNQVGRKKSAIVILKGLSKLRMIANHPQYEYADYQETSGKAETVMEYLDNLMAEGHKVLVFSNYKKQLYYFQQYATKQRYQYLTLTGETPEVIRKHNVQLFQSPENSCQIFFISMKAGGTGLNLTAATYTLLLDPWWNPQVEEQAMARIHRIGQENPTVAYRFISVGTIEEKIEKLQKEKALLSQSILGADNPGTTDFFADLSDEELKQLLV